MSTVSSLRPPTKVVTGFVDSTPLLGDPTALRARADADGYLFFRGFLPKEPLLELRRQVLEVVRQHGWLRKDKDIMEGVADLDAVARADGEEHRLRGLGVTMDAYRDIQKLELFHRLPHHPKLIALYEALFGTEVLPHPRHIARVLLPSPSLAPTAPHQDYVYIHGTHQFWTCWFPLGDVPMTLGGLSILRGSHREKVLDVFRSSGAGGLEAILCGMDYHWVQDDYQCGDIITFPSHTVHKSLPNHQKDRIRISCDLRYQPVAKEIEERSLIPHMGVATWDELYQDWERDDLKYYWKNLPLRVVSRPGSASAIRDKNPC